MNFKTEKWLFIDPCIRLNQNNKKRCWAIIHHPDRSGSQSFDFHLIVELKKVGNCFDNKYFRMHFNAIQLNAIFLHLNYFIHLLRIFFYNTNEIVWNNPIRRFFTYSMSIFIRMKMFNSLYFTFFIPWIWMYGTEKA